MVVPYDPLNDRLDPIVTVDEDVTLFTHLFRQMVLIRRFEEAVHSLFLRGEVYGSTHLCNGQEAVSVGVASLLGPEDRVAATYRGHGHVLAGGTSPQRFLEELLGRRTGVCGGRSGSMNVVDLEHGLIGCFGIVGGSLAAATGAALALKRTGGVAVGFFGDGAVNQAYFSECLNFARVARLPVLYVCENNGYGEYTPTEAVTPGGIVGRPRALDIPAESVDGQDVWAVRAAAGQALDRVRSGEGPAFLEARTYRYADHGRGDPVKYRPDEEVEAWRKRDPIDLTRARLIGDYGVEAVELDGLVASAEAEVERIRAGALAAPFPDPDLAATEFAPDRPHA
jgi:TPP-dependent pyruvate/acetoin dehydrogenase alpha subunit